MINYCSPEDGTIVTKSLANDVNFIYPGCKDQSLRQLLYEYTMVKNFSLLYGGKKREKCTSN